MNWVDAKIENDEHGEPMFKGSIELLNDKRELLASIVWFYDDGPFYAHAMDPRDTDLIRRIGPNETLEGAKRSCLAQIEGRSPHFNTAAYLRK